MRLCTRAADMPLAMRRLCCMALTLLFIGVCVGLGELALGTYVRPPPTAPASIGNVGVEDQDAGAHIFANGAKVDVQRNPCTTWVTYDAAYA